MRARGGRGAGGSPVGTGRRFFCLPAARAWTPTEAWLLPPLPRPAGAAEEEEGLEPEEEEEEEEKPKPAKKQKQKKKGKAK